MATSMSGKPVYGSGLFDITPALNAAGLKAVEKDLSSSLASIGKTALGAPLQFAAKWGKRAAIAIGGIGAAVGTIAIKGGITRALDMETATVQLKRMGVVGDDLRKVMGAVSDTVDGTTFTTPDMFKFAQLMIGTNIELEKLGPILTTVADFAAHANVPLDRMGEIFLKIQAQGRVTGRELNQLTIAGVALAPIADALDMTETQMRDLVSAGGLTAETFFEAAGSVEMYAGAAQAAGDTTRGAASNVLSQLRRLGEIMVSPLFGEGGPMVTFFKSLRQALIDLRPMAESAGRVVEQVVVPAVERMSAWIADGGIARGVEAVTAAWEKFLAVWHGAGDVAASIGDVFQSIREAAAEGRLFDMIVNFASSAFGDLVDWLGGEGLPMIVNALMEGRTKLFSAAAQLFPVLVNAVVNQIPDLIVSVVRLVEDLAGALIASVHILIPAAVEIVQTLVRAVVRSAPILANAAIELIQHVGTLIITMVPLILGAAITLFQALIDGVITILPVLVDTLFGKVLPQVVTTIAQMLPTILQAAIDAFMSLVQAVLDVLPVLIETVLGVALPAVITAIYEMVPELLMAAVTLFLALVDAIPVIVPQLVSIIVTVLIPTIIKSVLGLFPELLAAAAKAFVAIASGAVRAIPAIVRAVGSIVGSILGGVKQLPGALWEAGKNAIGQLGEGIKSAAKKVVNWVKDNVVGAIKKLWPFSPAKEGPFKGKGNPFFAGRNVMNLFADGIAAATPNVLSAAEVALPPMTIPGRPSDVMSMLGVGGSTFGQASVGAVGAAPSIEINVHNPVGEPTEESLQDPALTAVIGSYVRGRP